MSRVRRSRLLPRVLWLAARATAPVSRRVAGRLAFWLWHVPWQRSGLAPTTAGGRHHRLTVGGRGIEVVERGTGPTALLVHGWADHAASWDPVADALVTAGWRVVAVDLPAHGGTPGVRSDVIVQSSAVSALLTRFEVRAVVAHSLGAMATARALRAGGGDGVERAVFLAPIVRLDPVIATFLRETRLPAALEAPLRRCIERRFGPDVWDDVATDRNLAGSRRPGLIIHDEQDRRAAVDGARTLVDAWPGARLHTTSGLGHRRLLSDPDVVARTVAAVTSGRSADGTARTDDLGGSRAAAS